MHAFIDIYYHLFWMFDLQQYQVLNIFNMLTNPEPPTQAQIQADIQKRIKIEKQTSKTLKEMVEQVQFVLASGPHHHYFLGQENKKRKLKEMNSKYNNLIQSKLFFEIENGLTKINKQKKAYNIEPKAQLKSEEIIDVNKNQVKLKKKQAIEALNEVLKQQNELQRQQNSLLKLSRSFTKSQMYVKENPQWKSHLVLAIRRKRQLEKSLEMKSQQADHRVIEINESMIKAKKQRLEKQRAINLKIIQEKKERELILKQKEKQSKIKCQQFVHKNKPQKYRFEIMSERGNQKLKIVEYEREQKLKQYKQMRKKYDWSELKDHQEKYFQTLSERKQEWMRNFEDSVSRVNKRHQKTIFFERLKEEDNQRQLQEQIKQNRKREFLLKIKDYGASVLQNHMPRSFIKSSNQLKKEDKTLRQSLNRVQQRQKGLQYLTEGKKHRKTTTDDGNKDNMKVASLPTIKGPAYKDYLKQQPKRLKLKSSFSTVLTQKKGEWAVNAKSIIQRMDVNHKKSDKNLLDAAFKKIQLLNAIM